MEMTKIPSQLNIGDYATLQKLSWEKLDRKKAKEDEAEAKAQAYWKSRYAKEMQRGMRRPEDVPSWLDM